MKQRKDVGETLVFQHRAVATSPSFCPAITSLAYPFLQFSTLPHKIFLFWYVHVPTTTTKNPHASLASSSVHPFLLQFPLQPFMFSHPIPWSPPSLLLQSPSVEALSLTNSSFPHLKHSFWHRAAVLRLLLSNWSDGKRHVSVSQPTSSWWECNKAKHPGFISEDYKAIM